MLNYLTRPDTKKVIAYLLMILMLNLNFSCRYFKAKDTSPEQLASVAQIGEKYNHFIIHANDNFYALKNIEIDSTSLSGNITSTEGLVAFYEKGRTNRIKKNEREILHEVHIYLKPGLYDINNEQQISIPHQQISEIKVIDPDTGKTVASYVLGTIGVLAAAFVLITIIILLTKSSCPYVYTDNGELFVFEGEIFGGAIMKNLERHDFMPLPSINNENSKLKIRITNELLEKHYVDLASLIVVEHPLDYEVLLDSKGKIHTLFNPDPPITAETNLGINLMKEIQMKDKQLILFNEDDQNINSIHLKFENKSLNNQAKLVLRAKNSLWLDYIFGKFAEKFGNYFSSWMTEQSKLPQQQRLDKVVEEKFPLTISVLKNNHWEIVEHIPTVGPLAFRDFVIPVPVDPTIENVEIRIETGFMFWELDYAALDFSSNSTDLVVKELQATSVASSNDIWQQALAESDDIYMIQPRPGEIAELTFEYNNSGAEDRSNSYFLHTEGYYELIRDFKGLPQIGELIKFKEIGYFSEYSRKSYESIPKANILNSTVAYSN